MKSLLQAYQAFERRIQRGEFPGRPINFNISFSYTEPAQSKLGDWLIRTGWKLKGHQTAGKPMAWSPMTGSKS